MAKAWTLIGGGVLAALAVVLAASTLGENDAVSVECSLGGREPNQNVTVGPGVAGIVLLCDQPVQPSNVSMTLDGAEVEVDLTPGEGERFWAMASRTLLDRGEHTVRVEVEAGGEVLAEEWSFPYIPPVRVPPGADSPPAVAVIERADGVIDIYEFDHTPVTCGEGLITFFCAAHFEIPFTPIRYAERDFFAGIIPADETIRPRDESCFTTLAASDEGPEAPRALTLEPLAVSGGTGTTLTWEDPADGETCYVVERGLWGQYPQQTHVIATLPPDTTTYVDERPYGEPGGVVYRVYAATADARSEYSEPVAYSFTTPATAPSPVCFAGESGDPGAPAAPTALETELVDPVSRAGWGVDLSWTDNAGGEFCYIVEVEVDGAVEMRMLVANETEAQYTHPLTRTPKDVTFRVSAATETARSPEVTVTVEVPGIPLE